MDWPDLRENIRTYLYGDSCMVGQGEWIIYRHFIKGQLTTSWSPTGDEAIGGGKFKYVEFMVKYLQIPIGGVFHLIADWHNSQGVVPQKGQVAVLPWNFGKAAEGVWIRPMIGDMIYRIRYGTQPQPPEAPYERFEQFRVLAPGKSAGDQGRPEAWIVHIDTPGNPV